MKQKFLVGSLLVLGAVGAKIAIQEFLTRQFLAHLEQYDREHEGELYFPGWFG